MSEDTTKPYITLKGDDGLIRLWTDKQGLPYKVELRTPKVHAYLNVDEFVKKVRIDND